MRWRYDSAVRGKSKLMTTLTAWISIPRVRRSDVSFTTIGELTRTDKIAGHSLAEVMEDTVAVGLEHFGM